MAGEEEIEVKNNQPHLSKQDLKNLVCSRCFSNPKSHISFLFDFGLTASFHTIACLDIMLRVFISVAKFYHMVYILR